MELEILKIDCGSGQCGACCSDVGVPPYRLDELFGVPWRVALWLLARVAALVRGRRDPRRGPCLAFDQATRRCRIYRWRPALCRDMPVGGDWCLRYRQRKGLP